MGMVLPATGPAGLAGLAEALGAEGWPCAFGAAVCGAGAEDLATEAA